MEGKRIRDYSAENIRRNRKERFIGFELDEDLLPAFNERVEKLGTTKKAYIQSLILKDMGLKLVPAHYEPLGEKDAL